MSKPKYRFYKGEKSNPFADRDVSLATFWYWEKMFDERNRRYGGVLDASRIYQRSIRSLPEYFDRWDAPPESKGLLIWMILQCGRWMPYVYTKVDWERYTQAFKNAP